VYGLDGRLSGAPRFSGVPGFDKGAYPLIRARVGEWHGWVFVNPSGDAAPFAEHVGNLDELLAPWEAGRLRVAARHEYVIAANWKTITENYHECYHCPSIHPALCDVTPVDSGENFPHEGLWVGGSMELKDFAQTMSLTGESAGVRIRGLNDRQAREVSYVGLFPNLLISLHPDYVMTHRFEPLGPGETEVTCEWLFPPEAWDRPGFSAEYASEFWDLTNREDWRACESVYRGLQSRGFRQGPFEWSEDEVHSFMALVARGYLDGRASAPPPVHAPAAAAS
jgi:Rieske 2Fe-2S family protein